MRNLFVLVLIAAAVWGQPAADSQPTPLASVQPVPPASAQPIPPASVEPIPPASTQPIPQVSTAGSIDKQRASIMKQVSAVTNQVPSVLPTFFSVPWVEGPPQASAAACEPMPDDQLAPLIDEISKQEGVSVDLIRAVINQESGGRPCAVSPKGAQGLMQLMPSTAIEFGVNDPFNPKQNVEAGAKLLKQLLAKYSGNVSLSLAAYNAGSQRVDRDGGVPAIPETVRYVDKIQAKLPNQ